MDEGCFSKDLESMNSPSSITSSSLFIFIFPLKVEGFYGKVVGWPSNSLPETYIKIFQDSHKKGILVLQRNNFEYGG